MLLYRYEHERQSVQGLELDNWSIVILFVTDIACGSCPPACGAERHHIYLTKQLKDISVLIFNRKKYPLIVRQRI